MGGRRGKRAKLLLRQMLHCLAVWKAWSVQGEGGPGVGRRYGNVGRESRDEERQDEKYIIRELISAMQDRGPVLSPNRHVSCVCENVTSDDTQQKINNFLPSPPDRR
jgi:hypothetical protein